MATLTARVAALQIGTTEVISAARAATFTELTVSGAGSFGSMSTTGNVALQNTTFAAQNGVITKGGARFIHDFNFGLVGAITTDGFNTFVGRDAGNLTMGSTATAAHHGSYNTAVGVQALQANTTGFQNTAVGVQTLFANTTGFSNTAVGTWAVAANTTGFQNTATGVSALQANTTGYSNTATGVSAGRFVGSGASNETGTNSVFLGFDTRPLADGQTNQIVIGASAIGAGSNTVTLGNTAITATILRGAVTGTGTLGTAASPWPDIRGTAATIGALAVAAATVGFFGVTPFARPSFAAATGTATRTAFDTATVTTAQLAERVKALVDDLRSYGLLA